MNTNGVSPGPKSDGGLRVVPVRDARPDTAAAVSVHTQPLLKVGGAPRSSARADGTIPMRPRSDPQANFERMMARIEEMERARAVAAKAGRGVNVFLLCLPLTLVHGVLAVFLMRSAGLAGSGIQGYLWMGGTVLGLYVLNVTLFALLASIAGKRRS